MWRRRGARSRLTAAVVAALGLSAMAMGPAWAAWNATTTNGGNNLAAAATFPTYPTEATSDSPWAYYREEDAASAAATSVAADSSGNGRSGTYNGTTNGPSTYYSFDENSGATAQDSSGAVNTGTLVNAPAWSAGKVNAALSFNGTDQYVEGASAAIHTDTSFSVAAWVYLTSKNGFATAVSQDGTNISGFFLQYDQSVDRWGFTIRQSDSTGAGLDGARSSTSPSLDTWYHLVGVYDSSTNQLSLYVDGILAGTATRHTPWDATGAFAVGRAKFGPLTDFWPGMIDDVRVYQRALSPGEVTTLANGLPAMDWEFTEGAGPTTADRGTGGSVGTLSGGATWTTAGHDGNAVSLDGTSAGVVSPASVVATNTSFSVAAWVYLTSKSADATAVSEDGTTVSNFYLQYEATNDRFGFLMRDSDSTASSGVLALGTASPALNTWYHLVGVYDSSANQIKLYVNGSLQATTAFTTPWNATGQLAVGQSVWNSTVSDYWPGMIDSVKAYQRALGDTEVANTYNATDLTTADFTAGITGALQGPQQGLQSTTSVAFAGYGNGYAPTSLVNPATFTIDGWFRSASNTGGVLMSFSGKQTGSSANRDRIVYLDSGGHITFGVNPGGSHTTLRTAAAYNDGAWHHVAASLGAAGMKLYLDGVLVASDPATTSAQNFTGYWRWGGENLVGWPNAPATNYLTGTLDEVAFYSTQLSDLQIAEQFHANH